MLQTFYINSGSVLPILRMELIDDGRSDYRKISQALQNCTITFSMVNEDNGITKIANAPAYIKPIDNGSCVEEYLICYNWKPRDTNEAGNFKGQFNIEFNRIKNDDGTTYPTGNLIMPIREELRIVVR